MKKLAILLVLGGVLLTAQNVVHTTRYEYQGVVYEVKYEPRGIGLAPATYPPGPPHYDALVEVWVLEDDTSRRIWKGAGQYSEPWCALDSHPKIYIKRALEENND